MGVKPPRMPVLDPRTSGRPGRSAALTGMPVGLLVAIAVATTGNWIAAVAAGLAAALAVALPFRYLAAGQAGSAQEARELWGLAGLFADGRAWPAPGGWALGAGALALLFREIRLRGLCTVVELGPGASSVVLGRGEPGLEMAGLEHDERFVEMIRGSLAAHGLDRYSLIHAPLEESDQDGRPVKWYESAALAALPETIDVLIVDGPPNSAGVGNRSPAWPRLRDRMRPGGIVLVDDTDRPDERAMAGRWAGEGLRVIYDGGDFVALEVI